MFLQSQPTHHRGCHILRLFSGEEWAGMSRNPVQRGPIEKQEDWPWSRFRHYATGQRGIVEIESHWAAFQRGKQLPEHLRYGAKDG